MPNVELMCLDKSCKPISLSKIVEEKEWNFTGRPIEEVLKNRKKLNILFQL